MLRFAAGKPVHFPFDVRVHMVAAAYGQSPMSVREWPADEFMKAQNYLAVTRGQ